MQKLFKSTFIGFLAVLALVVFSSRVSAFQGSDNLGESRRLASTESAVSPAKSTEFKQNACEVHVKVINLRQKNIIAHTDRVQSRLSKLTAAVEKYYTEKLVPAGKVVSNYNALVSDITAKEASLTAALDKVKADTEGLTCDKDQAKTQFATFRTDMQSLLKAFKDYRLSVLQLMQAVKKVGGSAENNEVKNVEAGEK